MKRFSTSVSIIVQYSLFTLILVIISTAILVDSVSRLFEDYVITSHISLYPELIEILGKTDAQMAVFLAEKPTINSKENGDGIFKPLLHLGQIFRIKIWNPQAMVLWSDEQKLIGTQSLSNAAFLAALKGKPTYEIKAPDTLENVYESDQGILLEIYSPIIINGEVRGVIEFYESTASLQNALKKGRFAIMSITILFGSSLYLLQLSVFYISHKKQKQLSKNITQARDATVFALASLAENRDADTGAHLERTSAYILLLATASSELFPQDYHFDKREIEEIVQAAPLHDIGKVGIPDAILLKPGPLSAEEFKIMKTHSEIGANTLEIAQQRANFPTYLKTAITIARFHHERWDGTGYPKGLKANEIPLEARLMAIVDVYDALRSKRPYKDYLSHQKACEIICQGEGSHFDPKLVAVFRVQHQKMDEIFSLSQD